MDGQKYLHIVEEEIELVSQTLESSDDKQKDRQTGK